MSWWELLSGPLSTGILCPEYWHDGVSPLSCWLPVHWNTSLFSHRLPCWLLLSGRDQQQSPTMPQWLLQPGLQLGHRIRMPPLHWGSCVLDVRAVQPGRGVHCWLLLLEWCSQRQRKHWLVGWYWRPLSCWLLLCWRLKQSHTMPLWPLPSILWGSGFEFLFHMPSARVL